MENPLGVRIIEIPSVKMARSGNGSMDSEPIRSFEAWFSALPLSFTPWDFMYFDPEQKNMVWMYALVDPSIDPKGFDVIDFVGGLYAAAISVDGDDGDGEQVYAAVKEWIGKSGVFEVDERNGRYCMFHVPTPPVAYKAMGYGQLDIFVPICLRGMGEGVSAT